MSVQNDFMENYPQKGFPDYILVFTLHLRMARYSHIFQQEVNKVENGKKHMIFVYFLLEKLFSDLTDTVENSQN